MKTPVCFHRSVLTCPLDFITFVTVQFFTLRTGPMCTQYMHIHIVVE